MFGVEDDQTEALLTVGHMARRSGLTTKALRHYDRIGLLPPAYVDRGTGYRRYRTDQVGQARLVQLLRSLDLPLDQVRAAVAAWNSGDGAAVLRIVREHRRRLDARVTRMRGALHRIDHLLAEGIEATMTDLDGRSAAATAKSPLALAASPTRSCSRPSCSTRSGGSWSRTFGPGMTTTA